MKTRKDKTPQLAQEVVLWEILPKLPTISLIRFKSVCKEWLYFITNNVRLKKAHHDYHHHTESSNSSAIVFGSDYDGQYPKLLFLSDPRQTNIHFPKVKEFDMSYLMSKLKFPQPETINLIKSSNGLVLLSNLILWNPATRDFRRLPSPAIDLKFDGKTGEIFDLAFVDGDHKVLRVTEGCIIGGNNNDFVWSLKFQVFSKRSDSWMEFEPIQGFSIYSFIQNGISIDGAFYFFARDENYPAEKTILLSFTYRDEVVQTVIDAPIYQPFSPLFVRWKKSSLAFVAQNSANESTYVFWVLINNDDGFYWSKLFTFRDEFICGAWSDRFLIIHKRYYTDDENDKLVLWDPQSAGEQDSSLLLVKLLDRVWDSFVAVDYVPTLVSVVERSTNS